MRKLMIVLSFAALCSCGSKDTGEGYTADTTALNPDAGSNANIPAGDRKSPSAVGDTVSNRTPADSMNMPQH